MRLLKSIRGVSLIELVMAMAIGGLMIAVVIAGQASLNKRTSFAAAIDKAKNQLQGIKAEAVQNINVRPMQGGNSSELVFGKVVEYDPANKDSMTVSTLVEDPDRSALSKCDSQQVPFEQGVQYSGTTKQAVIFTTDPERVYIAPNGYSDAPLNNSPRCTNPGYSPPSTNGVGQLNPACADSTHILTDPGNSPYGVCTCPGGMQENPNDGNHCEVPTPYPRPIIISPADGTSVIGNSLNVRVSGLIPGNTVTVKAGSVTCAPSPAVAQSGPLIFTCDLSSLPSGQAVPITATQTNNFGQTSPAYTITIYHYATRIGPPRITSATADGAYVNLTLQGNPNARYSIYECFISGSISDPTCSATHSWGFVPDGNFDGSGNATVRFKSSYAGVHDYMATQTDGTGESAASNVVSVTTYARASGLVGYYYRTYTATGSYQQAGTCYPPVYDASGNIIGGNYCDPPTTIYYNYDTTTFVQSISGDKLGTGYTYPNWISTLQARTNASYSDAEEVDWYGYIKPDRTDTYQVCTNADDGAYVNISGTRYSTDWPGGHTPTLVCGSNAYMTAGTYYSLMIGYHNTCRCAGDGAAFQLILRDSSGRAFEVPNSWYFYDTSFSSAMGPPDTSSLVALGKDHVATGVAKLARQESAAEQTAHGLINRVVAMANAVVSAPAANADAVCDNNILNPNNYNSACFGANQSLSIPLAIPAESGSAFLDVRHDDNSIERRVTP